MTTNACPFLPLHILSSDVILLQHANLTRLFRQLTGDNLENIPPQFCQVLNNTTQSWLSYTISLDLVFSGKILFPFSYL